ncbi:MAG: hypothetical protein K2X38_09840 [Gemmataceae bacterium]|nr:hypothetical protein [Gemmataceae bacterium]
MDENTNPNFEKLRLALHGLTSPFWCEGNFDPGRNVALGFTDGTRFEVVRAKNAYEQTEIMGPLLKQSQPAPFGMGKATRHDRRVRDALQIKAENGQLAVEGFDLESSGILGEIQKTLVPHAPGTIRAELYAANTYTSGGHFAPHKDTPRGKDMFGSLVVCLPSQFTDGNLVLRHHGLQKKFAWANAIRSQASPTQVHWAAFFGDVDHQIEPVWHGARITLTYLLRFGSGDAPPKAALRGDEMATQVQAAWQALLLDPHFMPKGGTLAYPCCHLYHQDARFQKEQASIEADMLKGRDAFVAHSAIRAGLKVAFQPYMYENDGQEMWQMARFPTKSELRQLPREVDPSDLEAKLPIRANSEDEDGFDVTWIDSPPAYQRMSRKAVDPDAQTTPGSELPAAGLLHSCEYSATGYFGNEGGHADFYTYAALHLHVPRFGSGPRLVAKLAKSPPTKRATTKPKRLPKKRKSDDEK